MNIKTADYTWCGGQKIDYDADAPCWLCGFPVESASMGGTVLCPACDCGRHRDGTQWTYAETLWGADNFRQQGKLGKCPRCEDAQGGTGG